LDLGVTNIGGKKVFKAKLESKGNVLKRGLGVKVYKFGKIIRELKKQTKKALNKART
jgi:hypothetical protein